MTVTAVAQSIDQFRERRPDAAADGIRAAGERFTALASTYAITLGEGRHADASHMVPGLNKELDAVTQGLSASLAERAA